MCGFVVGNRSFNAAVRGPDLTTTLDFDGVPFVHHLLHLTGERTPQPLVKGSLVCVFNGEIYNWRELGDYRSDGECILDAYEAYGLDFARHLDGEFAIVIKDGADFILATDPFATKPLWVAPNFSVGSYASDLHAAGVKVRANTTELWRGELVSRQQNIAWDLRQFDADTTRWVEAFERAVQKRAHPSAFIGLSSGYDSGGIAKALHGFKAYSILNNENIAVLGPRLRAGDESFRLEADEYARMGIIMQGAEDFRHKDRFLDYDYKRDKATMGLAAICTRANRDGLRVYISGQGADEILSDYGHAGEKFYIHSEFGGLFPEEQRLWHSFNDGTNIQYLNKEEYTAGHFGIEARYPYLDREVVQAFLNLTPKVKNSRYKAPLHDYLQGYPFEAGVKRGFDCRS